MAENTRIYTHVSGKALKGMQQLFRDREIYISANTSADGYTVMTAPKKGEGSSLKHHGSKRRGKVAA